jgi:hypothetical protein
MTTRKYAWVTGVLLSLVFVLASPRVALAGETSAPLGSMIVKGTFTTEVVPCGTLCTQSFYKGDLEGRSDFTLGTLEDTKTPDVSRYTGTLVHHTKEGDLIGTDVGYWNTATGAYVDTYRISSGTGVYEGARGILYLAGTLDPVTGTGASTYQGYVTWPCD